MGPCLRRYSIQKVSSFQDAAGLGVVGAGVGALSAASLPSETNRLAASTRAEWQRASQSLDGLRSSYYRDLAEHERVKPAALRAYEDKLTQATSDLDAARPRAMQEIKRLEGFAFSPKERARRLEGISKARGEIGDLVARQRAAEKSLRDARLAFDGTEAVLASRKMAIPTAEAAVEQAAQAMQRSQMARRVRIAATAGSTGAAVGALGFSL